MILGILFLCSAAGIYALPKVYVQYQAVSGKVAIHLEEYTRIEGVEHPWRKIQDVLPGSVISKIPRIQNDGAACYLRATVDFSSEKQSQKPLDFTSLEGIGEDWIRAGSYFYYKNVVKPGEQIDFFQGIRIPAEWKSEEEENQWQAKVMVDAIQAECFVPDFSTSDPWGMERKEFVIQKAYEDVPQEQEGENETVELVIADQTQGFLMEQEGCMKKLETFVPGKSQSGKVVLKNTTNKERVVFFWAEVPEESPFLEKLEVTVQKRSTNEIRILYQGPIKKGKLEEKISLGTIGAGENSQVEFLFTLPEMADNAYASKNGQVKFWFTTAKPQIVQATKAVETKDAKNLAIPLLSAGIALGILGICLKRKNV